MLILRDNWYTRDIDRSIDMKLAGIYEWRIADVGCYVGKAKRLQRRIHSYPNNVRRMILGLPWHGNPSKDYRPIHHALRRAYVEGISVSVSVLEICDPLDLNLRERYWIDLRQLERATDGRLLLNAS